ncbi:MAG: slipin family protein [Treponema sp.]|jgi:regulator of protease activity HflC (stomatin/prohibitin superfamily)|nr:slipin family protein [Treponema sp.]
MFFKKPNETVQPPAKFSRRRTKPDLNLLLIRLILLTIAALPVNFFGAVPGTIFDPAKLDTVSAVWRLGVFIAALLVLFSIRKAKEWERAIVLRFGKFHKVKGPGFFFLLPLFDQVYRIIDIRIRVADFYAQETLTGDSVTVGIDAFCFWLVWDPQKAALEVENYEEAVALASKAALRNAISKNDLTTFLARGDIIEKQIQEEVEKQTTEWGITVQYIEITDIQIPVDLQNSLSRIAQAEREKKARTLLAEAEIEIAKKLEEAISVYARDEGALKLRILSILNEGLKTGNSMMLVPNSITEELKTKDIFGLQALNEMKKKEAN